MKKIAIAALIALAAAPFGAGTSTAWAGGYSPTETVFLTNMGLLGHPQSSPDIAQAQIDLGRAYCSAMRKGMTAAEIVARRSGSLTQTYRADVIASAVDDGSLCPDQG
ncbi:DUF732 domain-containing protein [Tsukamurella ocularis]